MFEAVQQAYETADIIVMTAAGGDFRVSERSLIDCHSAGGQVITALNDIVISTTSSRASRLRVIADDEKLVNVYSADGVVVSTPTGSTAYNLSAGGPVVHAELDAIVVTPICPFMLESRPVLLGSQHKVTTQLLAPAGQVKVIVDGGLQWTITENDYLLVQKASKPLLIISSPWKSYFNILRSKLNWGGASVDLPLPEKVCKHC